MFGRALQAVVWQQGTLITPQHLQHQDAHHHAQLAARLHGASPRNVGLVQLQVDALALQEGTVRLPCAMAIMPGGEVVQWHDTSNVHGAPPCRALPNPDAEPGNTLEVYLVLPRLRHDAANIALGDCAETSGLPRGVPSRPRFVAQAAQLPELTRAQSPAAQVLLARPNVVLAFGHELQEDDCRLHILTLTRLPHGGAKQLPNFLPQCLRLQVMGPLVARLQALGHGVQTALQHSKTHGQGHPRAGLELFARHRGLMQLQLILADVLCDPFAGPLDVYRQLRLCVPWLVTDSFDLDGPSMRALAIPFDDTRPGLSLWPLVETLEQAVASGPVPVRSFSAAPMARSGLFLANVSPWPQGRHNSWFLQVVVNTADGHPQDDDSRQRSAQAWQRLAKVAAPSQMPRLIRSALRGIGLTPAESLWGGMATAQGALLFALDTQDPGWPLVQREGDIVLLPPPGSADTTVELTLLCLSREAPAP